MAFQAPAHRHVSVHRSDGGRGHQYTGGTAAGGGMAAPARHVMSTLSIVIPAYNEERFIGRLLEQIKAVDLAPVGVQPEIIVVDDCSRDRTAEIASAVSGVRLHRM